MIPLPRASVLAAVMILGIAVGMMAALFAAAEFTATRRPDIAMALVVAVPSVVGLLMILASNRRGMTALGAMILAIGPGCFGVLTAMQVASGA